ncbi:MAG: ArnT family glycosyltransferase [Longimicrobiales bacterium]
MHLVPSPVVFIGAGNGMFRGPEGYVSAAVVVPFALAVALVLVASAPRTLRSATAWLGLALVGQAVALQIVHAGYMIGYQHYAMADLFEGGRAFAFAFVLVQSAIVLVAVRGRLPILRRFVRDEIGFGRAVLLAGIFVISSATLSKEPGIYVSELVFASIVQLIALLNVVLAAVSIPASFVPRLASRVDRLLGGSGADGRVQRGANHQTERVADHPMQRGAERHEQGAAKRAGHGGVDRFSILLAVGVTIACAVLAWFSYQRHPHVPDEVVYLYHARYFARGLLTLPLPPVPEAFNLDLMTFEATRWYSPVPPGWPAVLAMGAFFGAAWLVNPILNGINVLLAYVLLRELYGLRTARLATILLACSPWFLFMGMNFMTHTLTMTAALAAAVGVARLRRGSSVPWQWVIIAGAGIGMLALIRPLEGLVIAVLLGLWALGGARAGLRRFVPVAVMAGVSMLVTAITFPYNQALAGHAATFPLMAYTDSIYGVGTNALGFGANRGLGWPGLDPFPGHGAIDVLVNGNLNVFQVNTELLGWAVGSVLPILLLLGLGPIRRTDAWLMAVIGTLIGVHSFYWFSGGPDFGARYWYLILVPCIALAARGIETLSLCTGSRDGEANPRVTAAALALCFATIIVFVPWRGIDKYFHYRNMRPDVRRLASEEDFGRSLVFIRGERHPDYASAAIYNPLDLSADVPIYVWDRGPEISRRVLEAFPDRPIHVIDGPTRTGAGFHVAGLRIAPEELLASSPGTAAPRRP